MDMFRNLGVSLKLLRELRGRTLISLARSAGVGKSQLSKYENGKELPKLPTLAKLLRELGVTQLEFFYTLHLVEERALMMDGAPSGDLQPWVALSELRLSSESTHAAFKQLLSSLLDLYQRLYQDLILQPGARK